MSLLFTACIPHRSSSRPDEFSVDPTVHHDYGEVRDIHISYENIFKMPEDDYLVYFYSLYCGHCLEIKDEVIEFALCEDGGIYFVREAPEVAVIKEEDVITGVDDIADFGILGYPSLVEIKEGAVALSVAGAEPVRIVLKGRSVN